jgi:hypothetical protein
MTGVSHPGENKPPAHLLHVPLPAYELSAVPTAIKLRMKYLIGLFILPHLFPFPASLNFFTRFSD